MIVSGIRTSENFYNQMASLGSVDRVQPSKVTPVSKVSPIEETKPSIQEIEFARRNQNKTSFDFAQQYDPQATYSLKGSESSLKDLDLTQGLHQMQKDQMLEQYRFFVGDTPNTLMTADSSESAAAAQAARPVENFVLS